MVAKNMKQSKKEMIFQQYAENLKMLADNNLIERKQSKELIYICPICLQEYNSPDGGENPLTLEHIPPDALGGKANILTCSKCNSESGYKIDAHLVERLRQLDKEDLLPGTEIKVTVVMGAEVFRGTMTVGENGLLEMHHSKMNNHPEKLSEAMKNLKPGTKLYADFIKKKVIPENLEYALLKTGYLMVFEKCGYSLILDSSFDDVRSQILNPGKRIYSEGFWLTPPYPKEMSGVYFITTKGLESLLAIFNVNTGQTERLFATILPLAIRPVEDVITILRNKVENEGQFELSLYPKEQTTKSYLENIDNITAMLKWVNDRKKGIAK
jgi:hypothetical protein